MNEHEFSRATERSILAFLNNAGSAEEIARALAGADDPQSDAEISAVIFAERPAETGYTALRQLAEVVRINTDRFRRMLEALERSCAQQKPSTGCG